MRKVLYFGSFNPVHYGHTGIARYIASMPEADAVVIVPSPHNPFKDLSILTDPHLRLEQVRGAFKGISPKITVSDIEYHLQEPLYTINTLHVLQSEDPESDLILLIGADNIGSIGKWYKGEEILKEFEIWVYPRGGYDGGGICHDYNSRKDVKGVRYLSDAPLYDISSTEIRALAAAE
ncbi:MAG TPA: nicotinate (nicotinamide) nucleotide adenylyltransferase [Candidatus Coprenecus stercoravium]|uniref:Probable nicotinate-nucleotide adenylyltransferase n=1 Tax=Candidatus Coprenecus stercoravium TaxID=2840735 RepID=A0A9D2GRT4_9BACT|nr:nicotinate (nicotinamide) nucleotide adenylyltransferase [Candidatus Coprenecus stercoravium]